MRSCGCLMLLWLTIGFVNADADAELPSHLHQIRPPFLDPRPRLSNSQQAQILSDVQQHQVRFNNHHQATKSHVTTTFPIINLQQNTTPYSSLAKYKVDRTKQHQQLQQIHNQQQQIQQLLQQQQNKLSQQLNQNYLNTVQLQYNPNQQQSLPNRYPSFSELPVFSDQQTLQTYLEKQRELEILQKQREQLLLEQQELKKQQELLKIQQLRQSTTTISPIVPTTQSVLLSSPTSRRITPSEADLFLKAIANHQKKYFTSSTTTTTTLKPNVINEDKTNSKSQRVSYGRSEKSSINSKNHSLDKELLLKELKLALAESVEENSNDNRNVTTRDLILPNGQKFQVVQTPSDVFSSSTSTTIKPPKAIFEELTKGVLPPGAEFEVIRQKSDGKLEEIGQMPIQNIPAKKVTFVVLEEQSDGSYKVQGVKGNADKENGGTDVQTIVDRIKKGELKLPPPSTVVSSSTMTTPIATTASSDYPTTFRPATTARSTMRFRDSQSSTSSYSPYVTVSPNSVSTTDKYATSASSLSSHIFNTVDSSSRIPSSTKTRNQFVPTISPFVSTITTPRASSYVHFTSKPSSTTSSTTFKDENETFQESTLIPSDIYGNEDQVSSESFVNILRKEGFYAMAKYLGQSGLDNVLNETGPYTIFVPTDKAFRTLLVQLGGPEKAEQKFRENPRLLSGLLLHHVIPGAFRIGSLQDEMTGVSLAGTQLRVNEYAMHDLEWNDIKVTTINGARVGPNKRDIEIPQGVTHAIDRVMFPLPVGDLVQTLQADREKRFTTFLKLLQVSGLQDTLTGPKTFTVFAPTDMAFANASIKNGGPIWTEEDGPEAAKIIVSKHIMPSTMYTAGMRYYIQKDSLRAQSPIHIYKNAGRVRVNEAHIVTHNIPATNGVLHAIDGLLL